MGSQFYRGSRDHTSGFAYKAAVAVGIVCIACIALWLTYRGLDVLLTVFAGIVMAVLLHTLAEPLTRWIRVPLWAAVLIVTLLIIGALTAGSVLLAPSVSTQFDQMTEQLPAAVDRVRSDIERYKWTNWLFQQGGDATKGQDVVRQARRVFSVTMTAGAAMAIVAFLALYMSVQPALYVEGVVRLFPVSYRPRAREIMAELYRTLRIWLLTKLVSMAFVGVCVGVGLWLLKVPLALALGIVAALLEFIPTVGPLLSAAPAMLIAFVHNPKTALYVAILYFAVQWVQNHVTNPLLQQKALQLPPALGLVMVALLGALFGFGGLLLSGPLAVMLLVLVKRAYVEDILERGRKRFQKDDSSRKTVQASDSGNRMRM